MKIISRYVLREYLGNLLLGLLIFTFILLLDRLFELVDLLLNKGVGILLFAKLLAMLLPSSLTVTLPVASLLAALLSFGHFSETNEIVAMRASGLSAGRYIRMPLIAAAVCSLFLIPFNNRWAPQAHAKFRSLYLQLLQRNPLVRIEEKTFLQVGDYHLYVEDRDRKTRRMSGITIYKTPAEGAPLRIFAANGQASVDASRGMTLYLENGRIEQVDPARPNQWFHTSFKTYLLSIPFQSQADAGSRTLEEMDSRELRQRIAELKAKRLPYPLFACQLQLRWALAVTPVLFVTLGIPLGIRVRRGGRSFGFLISILVVVAYYVLLMGGTGAGQRGVMPALPAVWMGNFILAGVGAYFMSRMVRQ